MEYPICGTKNYIWDQVTEKTIQEYFAWQILMLL